MHIRIWETDRLKTFMRRRLSSCTLRCATNKTKICRSHNVDSDLASVNGICVCKSNESRKSSSTISIINRPSDCSLVLQIRRYHAYTSAIGRQEADDESDGSELPRSSGGSPHEYAERPIGSSVPNESVVVPRQENAVANIKLEISTCTRPIILFIHRTCTCPCRDKPIV